MRWNGLIRRAGVLLTVNGMIRTAKQLPEVARRGGAGLHSAWLGLPVIGGVAISKN